MDNKVKNFEAGADDYLTKPFAFVEHVWDQSFEGLTNIVDVYIRQLRAKIDTPFTHNLIHTVRRAGYTLCEQDEN